jgi:hypothetical protein
MKKLKYLLLLCLITFSKEGLVSGNVSRSGVFNSVFVQQSIGMKHVRGAPEMIKRAFDHNEHRLEKLQKDTNELAESMDAKLQDFLKNNEGSFVLGNIEENYELFTKGQSGYLKYATLSTAEEIVKAKGGAGYVLLSVENDIVIRFKVIPEYEIIKKLNEQLLSK